MIIQFTEGNIFYNLFKAYISHVKINMDIFYFKDPH